MFRTLLPAFAPAALSAFALTMTLAAAPAFAQTSFGHAKVAAVSASASPASVGRGGKGTLLVTLLITPGYHVNAHKVADPDLIPTDITLTPAAGVTWGAPRYPAARTESVAGKPSPVYMGRTIIAVPFTVTKSAKPGVLPLSAALSYQGCNASACFPPASAPLKTSVAVR